MIVSLWPSFQFVIDDKVMKEYYEKYLKTIPTADVVPVKHGKWIDELDPWDRQHIGKCSECGKRYCDYMYFRFCPNCGAKMVMKGAE